MSGTSKRKKSLYSQANKAKKFKFQFSLRPGLKGFIATCNYHEKDCVREAINILGEFADRMYGDNNKDSEDGGSEVEEDIEAALAREVIELKHERQSDPCTRRFQVIQSGADNCVFISTTVEDPVSVVTSILEDIEANSKQKTRFLLRLLPIETTCKAWPEDIKTASGKLLDKYFKGEPKTFCVVYKRRNNNNVQRDDLIEDIASEIKLRNPLHRADMKQPELVVIVEVIRNICCMAVVPKYFHYRKYNLLEVAKLKVPADKSEAINESKSPNSELEQRLIPNSNQGNQDLEKDLKVPIDQNEGKLSVANIGAIRNTSESTFQSEQLENNVPPQHE